MLLETYYIRNEIITEYISSCNKNSAFFAFTFYFCDPSRISCFVLICNLEQPSENEANGEWNEKKKWDDWMTRTQASLRGRRVKRNKIWVERTKDDQEYLIEIGKKDEIKTNIRMNKIQDENEENLVCMWRAFTYLDNLFRAVFRSKTELIMLSVLIDFCCCCCCWFPLRCVCRELWS